MSDRIIKFKLYRYHLLPIEPQNNQFDAFPKNLDIEEIKKTKNKVLSRLLNSLQIQIRQNPIRLEHVDGDYYLFKIANKKKTIITQNFQNANIPNEPYCHIIINNDNAVQKIAISENLDAFSSPNTVKNILKKALQKELNTFQLNIEIEEIFEKYDFWKLVYKYNSQIEMINFKFIKPNLSQISKTLPIVFREFSEKVDSHESHIIIKAPSKSTLKNINEENSEISGMIDYSAYGGGNIKMSIKGIRKQITTSESETTISISEAELEGPLAMVFNLYKNILK